jgi:hypothetical protein
MNQITSTNLCTPEALKTFNQPTELELEQVIIEGNKAFHC